MTSRLRQIFAATEPTSVEAAARRRDLAEAMQVRALRGTQVPQQYYTPATALADLGTSLVSAYTAKKANDAYGRAKDAKSAQTADALKRYQTSTPDDQFSDEFSKRVAESAPDELPMPVTRRSEATQGLIDTLPPDAQQQMVQALIAQQMTPKERSPIKLGAGESLVDPNSYKPLYAQPAAPSKPLDPLGQLEADRRAGLIDDEGYAARKKLLTTREPPPSLQVQMVPMKPEEIAAAGLPPGTAAQRNVQTGQIDVLSKKDNTGVLSQKDATTAKMKLNTVSLARQQLNAIKQAFEEGRNGVNAFGPGQGLLPTEAGKKFDSRVDQMRSTLTALTRVPGVGAMSDYETKLDQSKFPSRRDYESVTADKLQQLEDMLALIETGYTDLMGNGAQGQQPAFGTPGTTSGQAGQTPPIAPTREQMQRARQYLPPGT